MNRLAWKTLCNKTKWASGKKRLNKTELNEIMAAQRTLQGLVKQEASWQEKPKEVQSIKQILTLTTKGETNV